MATTNQEMQTLQFVVQSNEMRTQRRAVEDLVSRLELADLITGNPEIHMVVSGDNIDTYRPSIETYAKPPRHDCSGWDLVGSMLTGGLWMAAVRTYVAYDSITVRAPAEFCAQITKYIREVNRL